jgi:LysM repeat protein
MNVSQKTRRVLIVSAVTVIGVLASITPVASAHSVSARPAQTQCAVSYKVVRGDSWWTISRKAGTSLSAVLKANTAKTSTKLLVGKSICLPKSAKASTPSSRGLVLPPPAKIYSARKSTAIIREIFPKRLQTRALAIAKRESRLNAAAYNWCCVGLFQLNWYSHNKWLGQMGVTAPEQLLDARVNAEAAYALYKRSNGWGPWE